MRKRRNPAIAVQRGAILLGAGLLVCACSDGESVANLGSARWGDIDVAVESRPWPPHAGNNEVVVIVSGAHHKPVYDALVQLRTLSATGAASEWVQAIQDGHVGVYRRAVAFAPTPQQTLQVQLHRGQSQGLVEFAVALTP